MKTKVIVLLSIVMLVFSVPAMAWEIDSDANLYSGQTDLQYQGGQAILSEDGSTIGGEMQQESQKELMMEADSTATVDCTDCDEGAVGGFTMATANGTASQFDGQGQLGVFGSASVNIDKYFTMDVSKDGTFEINKEKNESVVIDKDKTKTEEEHESESKTVDVDKTQNSEGEFAFNVDKSFEGNADGSLDHTTTTTTSSDEGPPAVEETSNSDTWTSDGHLDGSSSLGVTGSGSSSETETVDVAVNETEDETESKTETFDLSVDKHEDFHLDTAYTENCSLETHRGTTFGWEGNGVMGGQVQGGYQSGYVSSTTVAGAFQYTPQQVDLVGAP
jgi:hypothetical protein